jgi:uncharacterized protein (DUF2147 family)
MLRLPVFAIALTAFAALQATAQDKKTKDDAVIKISAEKLAEECATDKKAAQKKYEGKLVELDGEVITVGRKKDADYVTVYLKGFKKSADKAEWKVLCNVPADNPAYEQARKLKNGQKVVIKGKVFRTDLLGTTSINEIGMIKIRDKE